MSALPSNIQTGDPGGSERARDLAMDSQMSMERKMSSRTLNHTDRLRSDLAGAAPAALAHHIMSALCALGRRFMNALYESRLRQANQIIRRYQHLIDDSNK
jgi:hypothetical protein